MFILFCCWWCLFGVVRACLFAYRSKVCLAKQYVVMSCSVCVCCFPVCFACFVFVGLCLMFLKDIRCCSLRCVVIFVCLALLFVSRLFVGFVFAV